MNLATLTKFLIFCDFVSKSIENGFYQTSKQVRCCNYFQKQKNIQHFLKKVVYFEKIIKKCNILPLYHPFRPGFLHKCCNIFKFLKILQHFN